MSAMKEEPEDNKCDIVHQVLCMACLCTGRSLHILKDAALQEYYTYVSSDVQLLNDISNLTPIVCWECEARLKTSMCFQDRLRESYNEILPLLQDNQNGSHVTWGHVIRPPRLQISNNKPINIPSQSDLQTTYQETKQQLTTDQKQHMNLASCLFPYEMGEAQLCTHLASYSNSKQTTDEVKQEIKIEIFNTDELEPCLGCLCVGRRLDDVTDNSEKQYYWDILCETQLATCNAVMPRLCYECSHLLRESFRFRRRVRDSYQILLPSLQTMHKQDINDFLSSGVSLSPRLQFCFGERVDILPEGTLVHQEHDHYTGQTVDVNEPHQCSYCSKAFTRKGYLIRHVRTHTAEKPYKCNICAKAFSRKETLIRHLRSQCGGKKYQCCHCPKMLMRKSNLINHVKIMHPDKIIYQCNKCSKSFFIERDLNIHMKSHIVLKPFKCTYCPKRFLLKEDLDVHIIGHFEEKPHICSYCSKAFSKKGDLIKHVRTHTGERPYHCSECEKAFARKGALDVHARTHTGEKPFQCSQCSKMFSRQDALDKHIRVHTGSRPYRCNLCPSAFSQNGDLNRHMTIHSGEKNYQCSYCPLAFLRSSDLNIHKKIHTGLPHYQCSQCSKTFSQKGNLNVHIRTKHTREKAYQCTQCSKEFFQKSFLKRHMVTHSEEKAFHCTLCSKSFTQKVSLTSHSKTHFRSYWDDKIRSFR